MTLLAAAVALPQLAACSSSGPFETAASDPVVVDVDSTSVVGAAALELGTQLVYHDILEQAPGGQSRLNALAPRVVRINTGTDAAYPGFGPELPEGLAQGEWSFAELDELVADVYAAGAVPLLSIEYAPNWMWTCAQPFKGQAGFVRDTTFESYGDYMARLVAYYNKGSTMTENGTLITNPFGTSHRVPAWELWNEPDLANTPCRPSSGVGLTAKQYVQMWNVVAPKMRAVDPTIALVGPTAANPPQRGDKGADDYFGTLLAQGNPQPTALSFHHYGHWENTATDRSLFDGIDSLVWGLDDIRRRFPSVPVWVTEMNVDAAWGNDEHGRPSGPLGIAWGASEFRALVLGGATRAYQYQFVAIAQFGLIDAKSGAPYLPYWRDAVLREAVPVGSSILASTSSNPHVETLAARLPDGSTTILVINRLLNGTGSVGGAGVATTVTVNLGGLQPAAVTLRQIDANTSAERGPSTQSLRASASVPLTFPGFGIAVLHVPATSAPR